MPLNEIKVTSRADLRYIYPGQYGELICENGLCMKGTIRAERRRVSDYGITETIYTGHNIANHPIVPGSRLILREE